MTWHSLEHPQLRLWLCSHQSAWSQWMATHLWKSKWKFQRPPRLFSRHCRWTYRHPFNNWRTCSAPKQLSPSRRAMRCFNETEAILNVGFILDPAMLDLLEDALLAAAMALFRSAVLQRCISPSNWPQENMFQRLLADGLRLIGIMQWINQTHDIPITVSSGVSHCTCEPSSNWTTSTFHLVCLSGHILVLYERTSAPQMA